MAKRFDIEVPDGIIRKRLEDFLFDRFPNLSRMYLRDVVKAECCEVNGRVENKGKRINSGDYIEIEIDAERETAMRPQEMELDIVYEDSDLILINKSAEILVHPTHRDKSGTLLNGLAYYLNNLQKSDREGGRIADARASAFVRPGLIHRLDKETSGLLLVAKNSRSHRILAKQFRLKSVRKTYLALVEGHVEQESGLIDAPIGRFAEEKFWDVKADGKPSETRFKVIDVRDDSTLLELEPVTGRTNQLRIHCASIGHPIVGDLKRGAKPYERLCLHSSGLAFIDLQGERRSFESTPDFI